MSDQTTITPPRPRVARPMILEAVRPVAEKLGMDADTVAQYYRHPMDGFELAMALSKSAFMDVSRDDMEELDGIESSVRHALDLAEKQWVADFNIQPPLPVGTHITKGVITGIDTYGAARYKVKENGCTMDGRSLLIRFEDAIPVNDSGSQP